MRFAPTAFVMVGFAAMMCGGCVDRTMRITSEPPGALVWLNDREMGRTPLAVDFLYYGTYDVRLELEGYEPVMTSGDAAAPWWDLPGVDLGAELLPVTLKSEVRWHYDLQPRNDDPVALVERAHEMRKRIDGDDDAVDDGE